MTVADVLEGRARWALIHGDNRDVLPTLGDKSVAHVITDPPYEAEAHTLQRRSKKTSGQQDGGAFENPDSRVVALEPLSFEPIACADRARAATEVARLSQRWVLVFSQVEAVNAWSQELVRAGMNTRRIGVWVKPDGMPQFSGDRPAMGYESIVFAHALGKSRWNGGGRSSSASTALP